MPPKAFKAYTRPGSESGIADYWQQVLSDIFKLLHRPSLVCCVNISDVLTLCITLYPSKKAGNLL
jgi:hypothetical protein